LLYIEDALGHEQYFQTKCKETISQIQDGELKKLPGTADTEASADFPELLWAAVSGGGNHGR